MHAVVVVVAAAVMLALGCSKERSDRPAPAVSAPATAGTVGPDGVRRIAVTAGRGGYVPAEITAKPNERLILEITRTAEGECLSKISIAGGPAVELPMNKAVDVPVTAPASGAIGFACGMDMVRGTIVVPSTSG